MILLWCMLICISTLTCVTESSSVTGTVSLDKYTFEKIIGKFDATLVKFDASYPYGAIHDTFLKFAQSTDNIDNFIAAEVHIQDYGKEENSDLAKRFSVPTGDRKKFPFIKLFLKNNDKPIDFIDSKVTVESLQKFVKKNSNVYFGLAGCIEVFDKLAHKFVSSSKKDQKVILMEAENSKETLPDNQKLFSIIYTKMMEKIIERGVGFVKSEKVRVENISKGKITDKKRRELDTRLNIIESFVTDATKDEL